MAKRYRVTLLAEERAGLEQLLGRGRTAARKLGHARILLKADEGEGGPAWTDRQIAEALEVGLATIARVRQRFVAEGLAAALVPKPSRRTYARKLDGAGEARLIALACSSPPEGRRVWTLQLLADQLVVMGCAAELSYETVRRVLKKRAQALAAADVVHSPNRGRGVGRRDGGPPGPAAPARGQAQAGGLHAAAGPQAAAGLLG